MKVVVGLGNPGKEYEGTRHNVGFEIVEALKSQKVDKRWAKSRSGLLEYAHVPTEDTPVELIKPLTFMNNSGDAVVYAAKKHSLDVDDIWVVHDDLDIRLGVYKIQKGKGPKIHYGIGSVEKSLGSAEFWRVRIGVDSRDGDERRIPGKDYVLMKFSQSEEEILRTVIGETVGELVERLF